MSLHHFEEQLEYSQTADEFWIAFYRAAFPTMTNIQTITDLAMQRQGIDRLIKLANGRILAFDEKMRRKSRPDFLLEYSAREGVDGWIEKDLSINYLAYAFMDKGRVYLLDWHALRRAWHSHKDYWLHHYPTITAHNDGYITRSCAVPIEVVQMAMLDLSCFDAK